MCVYVFLFISLKVLDGNDFYRSAIYRMYVELVALLTIFDACNVFSKMYMPQRIARLPCFARDVSINFCFDIRAAENSIRV